MMISFARRIAMRFCGVNTVGEPKSPTGGDSGALGLGMLLKPGVGPAEAEHEHHRPAQRPRRERRQRATRVAEEELRPLAEALALRAVGVRAAKLKTSLLRMSWAAHVSVGNSSISGLSRIRVLVLGHPAGVVQQRRPGVGVRCVELAELGLVVEVLAERLQEHRVEPAVLRVEQVPRAATSSVGMDARGG